MKVWPFYRLEIAHDHPSPMAAIFCYIWSRGLFAIGVVLVLAGWLA